MKNILKLVLARFGRRRIQSLRQDFGNNAKYMVSTGRSSFKHARKQVHRGMNALRRHPQQLQNRRLLSLLAGFGVGMGIGVLFAPSSGEMTRRRVIKAGKQFARADDITHESLERGAQGGTEDPEVIGAMSRKAIERQQEPLSTRKRGAI